MNTPRLPLPARQGSTSSDHCNHCSWLNRDHTYSHPYNGSVVHPRSGFVLIIVLGLLGVLAFVALNFAQHSRLATELAHNHMDKVQVATVEIHLKDFP